MAVKKAGKKKIIDLSRVEVSPERLGSVRGRVFSVIGKRGNTKYEVEVDHIKESPPGKREVYLTQRVEIGADERVTKRGAIQMARTKQEVSKRFPRISAKLPKLR